MATKVVVVVKRGLVEEVYSSARIKLEIIDLDSQDWEEEQQAKSRLNFNHELVLDGKLERVY